MQADTAFAWPTIDAAGHLSAAASLGSQRPLALSGSSANDSGNVTVARLMLASPACGVRRASSVGCLLSVVCPLPVKAKASFGRCANDAQSVAWNGELTPTRAPLVDPTCAETCMGAQLVGVSMNRGR